MKRRRPVLTPSREKPKANYSRCNQERENGPLKSRTVLPVLPLLVVGFVGEELDKTKGQYAYYDRGNESSIHGRLNLLFPKKENGVLLHLLSVVDGSTGESAGCLGSCRSIRGLAGICAHNRAGRRGLTWVIHRHVNAALHCSRHVASPEGNICLNLLSLFLDHGCRDSSSPFKPAFSYYDVSPFSHSPQGILNVANTEHFCFAGIGREFFVGKNLIIEILNRTAATKHKKQSDRCRQEDDSGFHIWVGKPTHQQKSATQRTHPEAPRSAYSGMQPSRAHSDADPVTALKQKFAVFWMAVDGLTKINCPQPSGSRLAGKEEAEVSTLRNLPCERIQCDEIWSFVGCKEQHLQPDEKGKGRGDVWTWTALDPDTKLMVAWHVGLREYSDGAMFMEDLASRLAKRIQLTTDGFKGYLSAVAEAFGNEIDYATAIKNYGAPLEGHRIEARYSPLRCKEVIKKVVSGDPDWGHVSTSHNERHNLTMRMQMRRFTRLTNGFSKKFLNHEAAVNLHMMHYNFARVHQTLRCTPAMEAGVSDHVWDVEEIIGLLDWQPERRKQA